MILGIDVGGTRTDSVLIDGRGVFLYNKTDTKDDLIETLDTAVIELMRLGGEVTIDRAVFSTTLATNAIVQNRLHPTGVMVMAGPGIDPMAFEVGPSYHVIEGVLDHQGFEVRPVNQREVLEVSKRIKGKGIPLLAIVGKFSPRNPEHEQKVYDLLQEQFEYISLGHKFSGFLNFPRRIHTTYLNAALHPLQKRFVSSLEEILKKRGIYCQRFLLKPDGGTFALEKSLDNSVAAAQSGPAASVMGAIYLDGCKGTCLVMDIGGTTTDMAVVIDGVPLLAPIGAHLGNYKTLIRSLLTKSVGIGGDSVIEITQEGEILIGPQRLGPPISFGGAHPTPTDALVTLGLLEGNKTSKALEAMKKLGEQMGIEDPRKVSEMILRKMAQKIYSHSLLFLEEINSRPVYTIREVLYEQKIEPDTLVILGGPSKELSLFISEAFGLPYRVPQFAEVANAIGAAVSKVTAEVTVYADTQKGVLVIPEIEFQERIPYTFKEEEALERGKNALYSLGKLLGADEDLEIQITEKNIFNMVKGFYRTGQNIRLKLCLMPGIYSLRGTR